jgi:hypothetical protein
VGGDLRLLKELAKENGSEIMRAIGRLLTSSLASCSPDTAQPAALPTPILFVGAACNLKFGR